MSLDLLRRQFPSVRRRELNDLLTRYRRVLRAAIVSLNAAWIGAARE